MASQIGVQEYLARHKVGPLFEKLMAKVISDQPDDPLMYLVGVLQLRVEKRDGKTGVRKSMNDLASRRRSPSPPLSRSLNTSASNAWGANSDAMGVAKDRGYDKPWQTNTKRMKPKKATDAPVDSRATGKKSMSKSQDWNNTKKPSTSTFDDLFEPTVTLQTRKACDRRSQSPPMKSATRPTTVAWAADELDDNVYGNYGYRGPHTTRKETDDPLAGEMGLAKEPKSKTAASPSTVGTYSKHKGRKADEQKKQRELEKYILSTEQKHDSGFEEERDLEPDNAVELMEDCEALQSEGVRNVKKSGVRLNRRQTPAASEQVRVSICATCAKVMTGGLPSERAPEYRYGGDISDYDFEGDSRPASARMTPIVMDDDEDFESVSQVTGPRQPVWQESDNDLAPHKGQSMMSSNTSPTRGRPMYSSMGPKETRTRFADTVPAHSADFQHAAPHSSTAPMRNTWAPPTDQSENELDESRPLTSARSAGSKSKQGNPEDDDGTYVRNSGGWQVADYDTDSSFYGAPGGGVQRVTKQAY